MEISASSVKELREKTGAGMMDCKNALVESKADMEQAIVILRKKGLASAFQAVRYPVENLACRVPEFVMLQFAGAFLFILCHLSLTRKFS